MGSCTRRHFLLSICLLQLLFIIERQTFDFLGYMWAPILVNFFHIIFVIFGFFGAYTFRIKYLVTYSLWNLLWIGWNVFLICFYLNVGELNRDSDILNLGTGSVSWFEVNGYGCKPTYPINITSEDPYRPVRPEKVDDCLLDYFIIEIIHAGLHCLLAFLGLIAALCIGRIFIDEDDSFDFMGGDAKSPQHTAVHPMYVSYTSIPTSISANSTTNNRNNNKNTNTLEHNSSTLVLQKTNANSSINTLLPPYKKSQSQVHLHSYQEPVVAAAMAAAVAHHHNNQSNNTINNLLRNKSTSSFTNRTFAQDQNLNSSYDDFSVDTTNTRKYLITHQQRNFGINNPFIEHFHRENTSYNSDFDSATESAHEGSPFLEDQSPPPRLPQRPELNTHHKYRHNQINPYISQQQQQHHSVECCADDAGSGGSIIGVRRLIDSSNASAFNSFGNNEEPNNKYMMPYQYVTRSPNLSRSTRRRYEHHGRHPPPPHQQQHTPTGNFCDQIRATPPGYEEQIMMMHRAKSQDRLSHRSRRPMSNGRNRDSQRPRSFCSNLPPYVQE